MRVYKVVLQRIVLQIKEPNMLHCWSKYELVLPSISDGSIDSERQYHVIVYSVSTGSQSGELSWRVKDHETWL